MNKPKRHLIFNRRTISNLVVVAFGIAFFLFLSNYQIAMTKVREVLGVISPFIWAFALAFILNMPMNFFEKKLFAKRKYKRVYAVIITYIIAFVLVGGLLVAVTPEVVSSLITLVENMPMYLESLNGMVLDLAKQLHLNINSAEAILGLWEEFIENMIAMLPQFLNASVAVGSGIINMIMAVIISIYMLISKDTLKRQCKKAVYALLSKQKAERTIELANRSHGIFSSFINGKMLDSAIIGLLCYIGMAILGLEYYILISVIVGITNMIPFFGPFIGAIPSILILVIVDPWQAVVFAVFVLGLQQFDGNILGPRILGNSTGLSPMWVLLAIVVGGGMFGFTGMLIGVPTFAVIYSVVSERLQASLDEKGITLYGNPVKKAAEASTAEEQE